MLFNGEYIGERYDFLLQFYNPHNIMKMIHICERRKVMKKNIIIALMATTLLLAGCSSNTTNSWVKDEPTKVEAQEDKDEASENKREESVSEVKSSDDIRYADMIPDPSEVFPNGSFLVLDEDGGKMYLFQITNNYTREEYDTYVEGCKEMGFTKVKYEINDDDGSKWFGAYTEDGKYWVEVVDDLEKVSVTCKTSSKHQ